MDLSTFAGLSQESGEANRQVWFVGSGTSIPAPSHIPSVGLMVGEAIASLEDPITGAPLTHPRLQSLLPEICYEALTDVLGPSIPRIWGCLEAWRSETEFSGVGFGPNLGHKAVVHLAWKSGTPVITTNFDTMLEAAAESLNLESVVSIPGDRTFKPHTALRQSQVAIWKVHGTASEPESVRTTLRAISRWNRQLTSALRQVMEEPSATVCFIGYSGRDIDLFPWITGFDFRNTPIWLDVDFTEDHRSHLLPRGVEQVKVRELGWAHEYVSLVTADTDPTSRLVESASRAPSIRPDAVRGIEEYSRRAVRETIVAAIGGDAARLRVARGRLLAAVGANPSALQDLDQLEEEPSEPAIRAQLHLLRSSLNHEVARYATFEREAHAAQRIARDHRLTGLEWHARISRNFAQRQQHLPGLHFKDGVHLLHLRTWRMLAGSIWLALSGWWHFRRQECANPEATGRHAYLEHLVRLGALIQAVSQAAGDRFARALMRPWWRRVRDNSLDLGYAHGVANSHKYLHRLDSTVEGAPEVEEALVMYEFLSAVTGQALYHRDAADRILARLSSAEDLELEVADRLRVEASALYRRSYQLAEELGDPSIQLKVLIQMRKLDSSLTADRDEAEHLLSRIEGAGFRRVEKDLVDWLCGASRNGPHEPG